MTTIERGFTLLELALVLALALLLAAVAAPNLQAAREEAQLVGAGWLFKGEFLKARSAAVRSNVFTAIRFEKGAAGPSFSVYADGDRDGVRADDIDAGLDRRVAGPFPLDGRTPGVEVGIHPGTPAIPPDTGLLDPLQPIRFGRSQMVSFSPLGSATPGTFYLKGRRAQLAVRVNGGSAHIRLLVCRGGRWGER